MKKSVLTLFVCFIIFTGFTHPVQAIVQYHKHLHKLYLTDDLDPESDLHKLLKNKKQRCLVCHQGKKKKNCNPYGEHFRKLLDKKKDKKDVDKIIAAIKQVEAMRSNPDDENSPTYGELLTAGKLPGGTLEELQKDPPKSSDEAEENAEDAEKAK